MKKYWILLLMALPVIISSCTEDEAEELSNYCYVSSVSLGTVKRIVEQHDREGNKISSTQTTITGSVFPITINQRNNTIENQDSLPYGCKLNAVLVNINYNGSVLAYRPKGSNAEWTPYNSNDSINLTAPIELYTLAKDGNSYRIYTFQINVHAVEGDSLYWKNCDADVDALSEMTVRRAVVLDGKLKVIGQTASGIKLATRDDLADGSSWTSTAVAGLPEETDVTTLFCQGNTLYVNTTDGCIYESTDGENWSEKGSQQPTPFIILAKTENYFYAMINGELMHSADANSWEKEVLDDEASLLPATDMQALYVEQNNGNNRLVLVGNRDGSTNSTVWNKMWNRTINEEEAEWMYIPLTVDNKVPCPRLNNFTMFTYDGRIMAFGGASQEGYGDHKAFDAIYFSNDYGITWRKDNLLHLPFALEGSDCHFTAATDSNHFIWIIAGNQVWRGRLNRLGFER